MKLDKIETKIFLTFFLLYSFLVYWVGSNENSRLALVKAIVDENRFEIDSYYNQTSDRAFYKNHYYSDKEPGLSFLAIPIYATWKFIYYNFFPSSFIKLHEGRLENFVDYVGKNKVPIFEPVNPGFFHLTIMIFVTIFTSSLFSSLTLVILYRFTRFYTKNIFHRVFISFIAGLATLLFPYGRVFIDHAFSTFLTFFSFYLLIKLSRTKKLKNIGTALILLGILLGYSISTSLINMVFVVFSFVFIIRVKGFSILTYFILGLVIGLSPLMLYSFLIFDNPFANPRLFLDPEIWHLSSLVTSSDLDRLALFPFLLYRIVSDLDRLALFPFLLYRITFDLSFGIFLYYPVLLLFFFGVSFGYKKYRREVLAIVFLVLSYFVFLILLFITWYPGCYFGPRFLTQISPFLVIPLVFVLDRSSKIVKIFLFVLFIYSFVINLFGTNPPIDVLIDKKTKTYLAPEFSGKIRSFEFLANPIYEYYFPVFLKNGIRSKLLEDLIVGKIPDIRFLVPEEREFFYLFYPNLSLISSVIILLLFIMAWGREILYNTKLVSIFKKIILIFIFSFFIVYLFFSTFYLPKEINYGRGWFLPEKDMKWMSKEGILLFYNNESEKLMILNFSVSSYFKERVVSFYLNDVLIDSFTVYPQISHASIGINLKKGLNTLKIKSSCDIPNVLEGKDDRRCLSIAIKNLSLDLPKEINYGRGWFLPEKDMKWMSKEGKLIIFNNKNKTLIAKIRLYLKSFYVDRHALLLLNNQVVDTFLIFKEGTTIYTPLISIEKGFNEIEIRSLDNCTIVANIAKNDDFRCISIGILNVSILLLDDMQKYNLTAIFNKGWYDEDKDGIRWMRNDASLSVFNFADEEKNVTFFFYLVPFYKKRTVHFFLNEERKNIFELLVPWEVYTKVLKLKKGENILRFLSEEECVEVATIAKNDDFRCITVGLKYIKILYS